MAWTSPQSVMWGMSNSYVDPFSRNPFYTEPKPASTEKNIASQQSSSSSSQSSSFAGIEEEEMRANIRDLITQMLGGGTATQREAKAAKADTISKLDLALQDYSKRAAYEDAAALMQLNLNKSMEANKPAIQRAVEGAGTSAGSMQALLSQRLASDASLQAGALGAEQTKAYGNIAAALLSQRGNLTTGVDDITKSLLQAMDLLKVSKSSQESSQSSSGVSYFNETAQDRLNEIALRNAGAADTAAISASARQSGGDSFGAFPQASISDPFSLINRFAPETQQSSYNRLLQLASTSPTSNSISSVDTTPSYMSIVKNPDVNSYDWYPSTYEYI